MCGLAGLIRTGGSGDGDIAGLTRAMSAVLAHRGPDDDGLWVDPEAGVALAQRRLAVVDLSVEGHQPMVSADGRYVLSFNGEVYNHRALADRLVSAGVRLRGHSDTEILLETIAARSLDAALEAANGMFALALWDRSTRRLSLARDRLGEKPLYYARVGRDLVFASELTALRRHPGFHPTVSRPALEELVRTGFVPGPDTIYEDVWKLQPGHVGEVDRTGSVVTRPYWSLHDVALAGSGARSRYDEPEDELVHRVDALLRDAVATRLVADVPVGAFLSGGIDSSLVVSLAAAVSSTPVRTFTVSVGGQHDEARHAREIARHLGTAHTDIDLGTDDALALARRIPTMYDEPFADPSAVPTALVCAAARRHVTVCLTGDGGDEVLAGYHRYRAATGMLRHGARMPRPLREAIARAVLAVPSDRWSAMAGRTPVVKRLPDAGTKLHKGARVLRTSDVAGAYRQLTTNADPGSLLLPAGAEPPIGAVVAPPGLDPLHHMLYLDQSRTLPDDMLTKVDRASMAVALECRVPLLDHRLVELSWGLPGSVKRRNGEGKWLLRKVLSGYVPTALWDRPKQGFDPPLAAWLRGPLSEWVHDLLAPDRLTAQGLFDARAVDLLVREHLSGASDHAYGLWTLVVTQAWLDAQAAPQLDLSASAASVAGPC